MQGLRLSAARSRLRAERAISPVAATSSNASSCSARRGAKPSTRSTRSPTSRASRTRSTTPSARYSSGMKVRLAFSIATSIRPDVFLLDEILAVGDEFFAERSFERIREIADGGRVTLVASHDWNLTFRLCTRIVWLENGRVRADGTPHEIFDEYLAYLNAFELTKQVEIERVEICGDDGVRAAGVRVGRAAPAAALVSGDGAELRSRSPPASSSATPGRRLSLPGAGTTASSSRPRHEARSRSATRRSRFAAGDYSLYVALAAPEQGAWPTHHLDMWIQFYGHDTVIKVHGRSAGGAPGPARVLVDRSACSRDRRRQSRSATSTSRTARLGVRTARPPGLVSRPGSARHVHALRGVSFDVAQGEVRRTRRQQRRRQEHAATPDRGRLPAHERLAWSCNGNVHAVLEIATGLLLDRTGRENIHYMGGLYGASAEEMREREARDHRVRRSGRVHRPPGARVLLRDEEPARVQHRDERRVRRAADRRGALGRRRRLRASLPASASASSAAEAPPSYSSRTRSSRSARCATA